jgi:GAF domain-containing protein
MATVGERLDVLYEVSRQLTSFTDLTELQRYVTRRAQEVFGAEGCAVMLHDRDRRELYFLPVVSQSDARRAVEGQLPAVRFPADRGIAGWVLANGKAALVPDTRSDPRFYSGIDQVTQMDTRAVLCAPLRVGTEVIGVIQVVNPAPSALTPDDLAFLEALASDVAVAHEKVLLYEQLRGEVLGLRQAARWAGVGVVAVGVLLAGGAVLAQLARALPLSELTARPALWFGAACMAFGVTMIAVARGRVVARSPA